MYKCITKFKAICFRMDNPKIEKVISINKNDILEDDGEYIVKDGYCICHKNSIIVKNNFLKV